jgi:type VI protein secretion system component Hcp
MAEYGIMVGIKDIKGNSEVPGYEGHLLAMSASFGASAERTNVGGGAKGERTSVEQGAVSIECLAGKWTAELLQALYSVATVGDVTVTQLAQAVDKDAKGAPTVIEKLTLSKAVLTSVSQGWTTADGPRTISITLEFEKILLDIDKKHADFTLRNITKA